MWRHSFKDCFCFTSQPARSIDRFPHFSFISSWFTLIVQITIRQSITAAHIQYMKNLIKIYPSTLKTNRAFVCMTCFSCVWAVELRRPSTIKNALNCHIASLINVMLIAVNKESFLHSLWAYAEGINTIYICFGLSEVCNLARKLLLISQNFATEPIKIKCLLAQHHDLLKMWNLIF